MNINQVYEQMNEHERRIADTLAGFEKQLGLLVQINSEWIRADVRGGVDLDYAIGLGATSTDNQTVGQVVHQVKPADGMVYGFISFNEDDTARYLRFYQGPTPPRVGSSKMYFPVGLPTGSGAIMFGGIGIPFKNGIWVAGSVGPTDSAADIASPGVNKVMAVILYK